MKSNLALCLRGTIDAVFVLRMQENYHAKEKKLNMCFVNIEKAISRVQRKVLNGQ